MVNWLNCINIPIEVRRHALEGLSPKTVLVTEDIKKKIFGIYLQTDDFPSQWNANSHWVQLYATIMFSPVFAWGPLGLQYLRGMEHDPT
jgi:hypothetical protein